jgi:hypothetical protein
MSARPTASVSLDLDNRWAYMKTHGDHGWEAFPSYLDVLLPVVLDALDALSLRITFFLVGQDAALEAHRGLLGSIPRRGHEVGCHSFHHEQRMAEQSREELRRELRAATEAITSATGQRPFGFRGPGFAWGTRLLEVLVETGYRYDASTFPTYIGPLARLYYFRRSSLSAEERKQRSSLYGRAGEGRRPISPYLWRLGSERTLLEIPVTTMPLLRLPFHLSYLLHLSRLSMRVMFVYLRTALRLCRATGIGPSFLLHPLDLLGPDQAPGLGFFPGMDLSAAHKRRVFDGVLRELGRWFTLVPVGEHARQLLEQELPVRRAPADREPGEPPA